MYEYVDLGYEPKEDDILVWFNIEGKSVKEGAEHIALESSIGTWTNIKTMLPDIFNKLRPHVYKIESNNVFIAYPYELFEIGNMAGILSGIAGNIYGMKSIDNLRLVDIRFPKKMLLQYDGPKYGINGVRDIIRVYDRPLVGTIIKPKVGLPSKLHSEIAYKSWKGGLDIVKDDENLVNQSFNPFEDRVIKTLEMRDKAEEETDEKKIYLANITAPYREMIKRAEFVKDHGGRYIMLDVVVLGFSAVQEFRNEGFDLAIHAHRAMHAALTRNKKHGITMLALAKIYRLLGVDQLHIGTVVGKMEGGKEEVVGIKNEISQEKVSSQNNLFEQDWGDIKSVFPVSSGGVYPSLVPQIHDIFGKEVIIQAGGGVHGHPDGPEAGARGMRQAIDASVKNIPLKEYAENHIELKKAIEKWGL